MEWAREGRVDRCQVAPFQCYPFRRDASTMGVDTKVCTVLRVTSTSTDFAKTNFPSPSRLRTNLNKKRITRKTTKSKFIVVL